MEFDIFAKALEQWVTVWLLLLFVWFFLTKYNKIQEQMLEMLWKQNTLIEKLIDKVDDLLSHNKK